MSLKHIIHDFINKGVINMDAKPTKQAIPVHIENEKLGIFTNPLPYS